MKKAGENSKIESVLRRQKATTDADRAEKQTPTPTTQGVESCLTLAENENENENENHNENEKHNENENHNEKHNENKNDKTKNENNHLGQYFFSFTVNETL